MIKLWDKLANRMTAVGLALFGIAMGLLIFGAGDASLIGGAICGLYSVILLIGSLVADKEALECIDRMEEYRREDGV